MTKAIARPQIIIAALIIAAFLFISSAQFVSAYGMSSQSTGGGGGGAMNGPGSISGYSGSTGGSGNGSGGGSPNGGRPVDAPDMRPYSIVKVKACIDTAAIPSTASSTATMANTKGDALIKCIREARVSPANNADALQKRIEALMLQIKKLQEQVKGSGSDA